MKNLSNTVGEPVAFQKWWGEFEIPENRWSRWRISSLVLFVRRACNEWHFAWSRGDDPLERTSEHELLASVEPDLQTATQSRHVLTGTDNLLSLAVMLADRAVIARPEVPLFVPPKEHAVLYVSTTLWLQPLIGEHAAFELPIQRLSDTWFGPDTRNGEVCYASLTRARTTEAEPHLYPHRAVTPVDVINRGEDALPIDRIRVPVTMLSLYVTEAGYFLTDPIALRRESEGEAVLEIGEPADQTDGSLTRLAEPREQPGTGTIVQAFSKLFG